MAEVRHLGYFPFCIRELAEDGEPFEEWDQSTLYNFNNNGDNQPSKSSSERITVYGNGTRHFIGPLNLEEVMYFYWRPKIYSVSILGTYPISVGSVTNTRGQWNNNNAPPPEDLTWTWTSSQDTIDGISATLQSPQNLGSPNQFLFETYTRPFNSELSLICNGSNTGELESVFLTTGLNFSQENDSPLEGGFAIGNVQISSQIFAAPLFNMGDIIKVKNNEYYIGFLGVAYLQIASRKERFTQVPDGPSVVVFPREQNFPFPTITSIEYEVEYSNYFFPNNSGFGSMAGGEFVGVGDPFLTNKNSFNLTLNFPNGSKTFSTDVYMYEYETTPFPPSPQFSAYTVNKKPNAPNLNIEINFPEHFEYDPNDGGGPIYDSTTGEKLREDRGMGPPWSSQ